MCSSVPILMDGTWDIIIPHDITNFPQAASFRTIYIEFQVRVIIDFIERGKLIIELLEMCLTNQVIPSFCLIQTLFFISKQIKKFI